MFSDLARYTWGRYAHDVARKHELRMAQMSAQARRAGRLGQVIRQGRKSNTFKVFVGKKTLRRDRLPPRTSHIRALKTTGPWTVDRKPVIPMNWQSGRSLATRAAALERAKGRCERCGDKPVAHVPHTVPRRRKTVLARVLSDSAQRSTANALCRECHLEVHSGSCAPRKRQGQGG
jgi:hypothetical protein